MELSEELLEIKNTEIRVLTEKLHEKDEFVRSMTIQYATYLADYENKWGSYLAEYDSLRRELYYVKDAYLSLQKEVYEESNKKDSLQEERIRQQETELVKLKQELESSEQRRKELEQATKIISSAIRKVEMDDVYDRQQLTLAEYVYDAMKTESIGRLLHHHIDNQQQKQLQALPIKAACDAGVLKRIPFAFFTLLFPKATVSETRYNLILNDVPATLAETHRKMVAQFQTI